MASNSLTRFLARIPTSVDEIMSELKMLAGQQKQSAADWWDSLGL